MDDETDPEQVLTGGNDNGLSTRQMQSQQDEKCLVLERLLAAHETWFDVERNYGFEGRVFPGYAAFHSEAEQYVLTKRAKLWGVNVHEYMFFVLEDCLTRDKLEAYRDIMTSKALKKVQLNDEHMTSYLSLVVVTDSLAPGVAEQIKKTRFRKNFAFGFKGWADLRLAVVDLANRSVITNGQGRTLRKTLEANAFL